MSSSFRPKAYLKPQSVEELAETLMSMKGKARIIGGGTGIYELAGRGLLSEVDTLVDISELGWSFIKKSRRSVMVGSAATMADMIESGSFDGGPAGAIGDALRAIQPLQVKNVATVAGAICTALPFFDLPVALLAVGARVHVGPEGRRVDLDDFIRGYFAVDLASHEFVTEVEVPTEDERSSAFQKFALTSDDWATMNCAASLSIDNAGRIRGARVVFGGGVHDRPFMASRTAAALEGVDPEEGVVKSAMENNVSSELHVISDTRSSSEYRLELANVLGRRTVLMACERAGKRKGK